MTFYAKHPITGLYDAYPDHYRDHPVFGKFEEVSKDEYDGSGCPDCGLDPVETLPNVTDSVTFDDVTTGGYVSDQDTILVDWE